MFSFVQKIKTPKKNVITGNIQDILESVKSVGTGYEVITGACIPYYDFEREYDTESERLANYKVDVDFAINALKVVYANNNIYEFTACGFDNSKKKYKNSFHFRVRGFGFHNKASEITKIEGFDSAVYNTKSQLFRLPYCTKEKQNRTLKRFNSATDEIIELAELIEPYELYLVQNIENEVLVAPMITSMITKDLTELNNSKIEKVI